MNPALTLLQDAGFGAVRQLGHVVEDIGASMGHWQAQGVGPWLWMRNVRLSCEYRGQPSRPVIDVALSYCGDMQIELIQQHNDDPSPYLATRNNGDFGLHHQAFLCGDIDQAVRQAEARGLSLLCDILMYGSRYVYMQGGPDAGEEIVELLPASWTMKTMFRRGIAASENWDGRRGPMVVDLKNIGTLIGSLPRMVWA